MIIIGLLILGTTLITLRIGYRASWTVTSITTLSFPLLISVAMYTQTVFIAIRFGLVFLLIAGYLTIMRNCTVRVLYKLLSIFLMIIIINFIFLTPFENLYGFNSPIQAFSYFTVNNEILDVVEYDGCAAILYRTSNNHVNFSYSVKTGGRWKLDKSLLNINSIDEIFTPNGLFIHINNFGGQDTFFVIINQRIGPELVTVTDNRDTEFSSYVQILSPGTPFEQKEQISYAFVDMPKENYTVFVNNKKFKLYDSN